MPLNVQITSDQICIVINIKALSGIKGFYFEVRTMMLDIGLALYCPAPLLTTLAMLCVTVGMAPCRSCLMSFFGICPHDKVQVIERTSETMV